MSACHLIRICRQGALLAAWLACPLAAQAQSPDATPPKLETLRGAFMRSVLAGSQTLTDQYTRALRKLEADLAAGGDYEQALATRQRADELATLYATSDGSLADSLALPLPTTTTSVKLSGVTAAEDGSLTGWRTAGSGAEWPLFKLNPGDYNLEFDYTLADVPVSVPSANASPRQLPVEKASFDFYEVSLLAGAAESRSFELSRTADGAPAVKQRVGPVHFTRGMVTLRLTASSGYPANIIHISRLRLVPVASDPSPAAPAASAGTDLEQLRASFAEALAAARIPVDTAYEAALAGLRTTSPSLAGEIQPELARLAKGSHDTALKKGPQLPRPLAALSGLAGFEDLDGARYVADAGNTGDRFKIEHDGKTYDIRLLWIVCAPPSSASPDAADSARLFASHFGIEPEDAALFGRAAQEFTAGYLEGKTLRVLLRNSQDTDGRRAALVFVEPVGLFQNVIADQGLAGVTPLATGKRTLMETALHSALSAHQNDARSDSPPAGAWAIGKDELRSPPKHPKP